MSYENVNLWFAKDEYNNIVTIDEIGVKNKFYSCPVCGSRLKPKAIKSKQITSHFAHVDASKCNSESMIHWWFKHKFIEPGDVFTIVLDEEKQFVCKDILVEEEYIADGKSYKPDVTILTECGNRIYFEMAFSNKKKVRDYLDVWLELKNTVVEIDIKSLISKDFIPSFKPLFYDGKCFNVKRNDAYYNLIGVYKEEKLKKTIDSGIKERIKKLDWLWDDILRYKKGEVTIDDLVNTVNLIEIVDVRLLFRILKKQKCSNVYDLFINKRLDLIHEEFINLLESRGVSHCFNIKKELIIKYKRVHSGIIHFAYRGTKYVPYDCYSFNMDILECTTAKLLSGLNKKIDVLKSLDLEDNNVFQDAIKDTSTFYNNISECCQISTNRYKCSDARIELRVNQDLKFDFPVSDSMVSSKNINEVKSFLNKEINKLIKGMSSYKDKYKINTFLDDLQYKYNNYLIRKQYLVKNSLIFKYGFNENSIRVYLLITGFIKHEHTIQISNHELYDNFNFNYSRLESIISEEILQFIMLSSNNNHCLDCDTKSSIVKGEIKFYIHKGFELPKRCKSCRQKKKAKGA